MSTVVSIFGANASGKSTVARAVLQAAGTPRPIHLDGQVAGYKFQRPNGSRLYVLGKYETACGGLDASFSYAPYCDNPKCGKERTDKGKVCAHCGSPLRKAADDCVQAVKDLAKYGNVFCEGIIAMSSWGQDRLVGLSQDLKAEGHNIIFGLLSPPWDVILQRLNERQAASTRQRKTPFDPEKTVRAKHDGMPRTHSKLAEAGCDCRVLDWQNPAPQVLNWLGFTS